MTADDVRAALRAIADPERARTNARYFRTGPGEYGENDSFLGIRVPQLRTLVRQFETMPLPDAGALLHSGYHEERMFAVLLLVRTYERGDESTRDVVFEMYLDNIDCIDNWDLVDGSAPNIVGAHLEKRDRSIVHRLAQSPVLWHRRIAIIATLAWIRKHDFADTLELARCLLHDHEDLIHKAIGWMLREIGRRDLETEERFLRRHAAVMPRTMLRYAIEKFEPDRRRLYMQPAIDLDARVRRTDESS